MNHLHRRTRNDQPRWQKLWYRRVVTNAVASMSPLGSTAQFPAREGTWIACCLPAGGLRGIPVGWSEVDVYPTL